MSMKRHQCKPGTRVGFLLPSGTDPFDNSPQDPWFVNYGEIITAEQAYDADNTNPFPTWQDYDNWLGTESDGKMIPVKLDQPSPCTVLVFHPNEMWPEKEARIRDAIHRLGSDESGP